MSLLHQKPVSMASTPCRNHPVSVVVTYNNIDPTRAGVHSLERCSDYVNLEMIVTDMLRPTIR